VDAGLGIEERSCSVAIREEDRLRSSKAPLTDGQEGEGNATTTTTIIHL
jgi:hypothetical protein